jgi:hypothetical protein
VFGEINPREPDMGRGEIGRELQCLRKDIRRLVPPRRVGFNPVSRKPQAVHF